MTALDTLGAGQLDLSGLRLGAPQQTGSGPNGALTMVPVFGPEYPGIVPPRTGLKLSQVAGYGRVELSNGAGNGVAIVPLHIGYVQDAAQNHALCRSAFLAAGQRLMFEDACCVQESQGGYLTEKDQWFFVLPVELRTRALELRGVQSYSKLWDDISALNSRYGLARRGHLEQILSRKRGVLTQFRSRLELLPGQRGALFFVGDRFAGLEIAPDPGYLAEMWMALVCFAYGVAAWHAEEPRSRPPEPSEPYDPYEPYDVQAAGPAGLRAALERDRAARVERIGGWLAAVPGGPLTLTEEDRYLRLRLSTVMGERLAGQVVTDDSRLVYASLFAPL